MRGDDRGAERAHQERRDHEQRALGDDRARDRQAEPEDLADRAAVRPVEALEQREAAVDRMAALVDVHRRQHRPAGERGRDAAAGRALRGKAESAAREDQLPRMLVERPTIAVYMTGRVQPMPSLV